MPLVSQKSNLGQLGLLDYRQIEDGCSKCYAVLVTSEAFKTRLARAMREAGIDRAELSRRSGVGYHAIDKFMKREGADTSLENAKKLADAVGISLDSDETYDELRALFLRLNEQQREFLTTTVRALASSSQESD